MDATTSLPSSTFDTSEPSTPTMPSVRRWARRLERSCCACVKYLPLVFVYGLPTWGLYVLVALCATQTRVSWLGKLLPSASSFPGTTRRKVATRPLPSGPRHSRGHCWRHPLPPP